MPVLSHNYEMSPDNKTCDRSKSEVLKWLSRQDELQMWMFCLLRAGGLIVWDKELSAYKGDSDWCGIHRKHLKPYRGGVLRKGRWIGGRPSIYGLGLVLDAIRDKPLFASDLMASLKISKSTMFRMLKRGIDNHLIERTPRGYAAVKTSTETTGI